MKPVDVIALAMKNEEEAMEMYTKMAECSTDAEQKRMFEAPANMEKGHKIIRSSWKTPLPTWHFLKHGKLDFFIPYAFS
jgi:rubrerythrin